MASSLEFLELLEPILGKGKATARGNYAFTCPICKHHKPKLEINLDINSIHFQRYHCWVCGDEKDGLKGRTLKSLFNKLKVEKHNFNTLITLLKGTKKFNIKEDIDNNVLSLPKEFISLYNSKQSIFTTRALTYLKNRKITEEDIIKYNIGYCNDGEYKDRIIIPSYDSYGNLNYFSGRSIQKKAYLKYKNPPVSRDIICFEFFINWNQPIILCEGQLDAIAIKRNVIPLLGKNISNELMEKLVTSKVKKIYIALDNDALKASLSHAEHLLNMGKEVYLVELNKKDPSDIGFEKFTELIQNVKPLTFSDLIIKKMNI